jgi:hypothetical protein
MIAFLLLVAQAAPSTASAGTPVEPIFTDKVLTTGNAGDEEDAALFAEVAIVPMGAEQPHMEAADQVIAAE